jgi:transcriptional regulator with XRE-family HTH domain
MTLQQAIGRTLRELRREKGLTQKELALKAGGKLDYSYVGKIERGEQLPSLKVLKRLGDALAVPVSRFFEEIEGDRAGRPRGERGRVEALDARRQRLLFHLARTVHDDDIPLLLEIVRLLNKRRRKAAPATRSPAEALRVAEEAESYPHR